VFATESTNATGNLYVAAQVIAAAAAFLIKIKVIIRPCCPFVENRLDGALMVMFPVNVQTFIDPSDKSGVIVAE
jgi:hypothetical protein